MMEVEDLSEYRSLLRERNNASLHQRIKYACMRQPVEKKLVAAVLVCFSLGITFIALKESYMDVNSTESILRTEHNTGWHYNTNEERENFLRLWENANETVLSTTGSFIGKGSGKYNQRSELFAQCELILEEVKRKLKQCVSLQILPNKCKSLLLMKMKCNKASELYRAWDGSCNNLEHTDWGMTGDNFNRWLEATYTDDVSTLRQSVVGGELPPVRYLSNLLFSHKNIPDSNATMLLTYFGLFLDHDMVKVGQAEGVMSSCCEENPKTLNPACLRIEVSKDDPFYGPLNVTCKGFLRSPPFTGACPGLREQQNRMTSYIDISDLYGSSHEEGKKLRTLQKGLLRHSTIHDTTLLSETQDSEGACYARNANYSCFLSGDTRANMLLPLTAMHIIWLREHNRVAAELSQINPNWNDETLYQESRKIVIAEYQHIIYKEFLPVIFGAERMKEHNLLIEEEKTFDAYDKNINAGITSVFATAAFRFGHTLVQNKLQLRDENYEVKSEIPLHETYMNPTLLYNRQFDSVMRGMIGHKAQEPDHYTSEEIRGRLLQRFFMTNGYDLTAMSILRGRDHGIPPYLKWREFCNLPVPKSWDDMKSYMRKEYVETLKEAYRSIEDIDFIPGAIGENHLEGAMLGPTYICLIGKQFSALRKGDRFWYENLNHPGAFKRDQLKEIYKASFARIVCDNSDDIQKVSRQTFHAPSDENPIVGCDEIQKIDLSHWKEV